MNKCKTSSVAKKERSFQWLPRLERLASAAYPYQPKDFAELLERATNWETCACSEFPQIAKDARGLPENFRFACLGSEFYQAVADLDWDRALEIYHEVEGEIYLRSLHA